MTIRPGWIPAATAAIATLSASLLAGWVDTERTIIGYGAARVVWSQPAWSGFFVPWLPLAALALSVAVALTLMPPGPHRRLMRLGASLAAVGGFVAVLAIGRDVASPNPANVVVATPGWPVLAGLVGAGVLGVAAIAGPGGRRSNARVPQLAALLVMLVAAACSVDATPTPTPSGSATAPDWRTDPNEPYPFRTPVPDLAPSAIDGEYTRPPTDTYDGDRAACRRCPPFPQDRGESVLRFDRGRYEIVHQEPAYRSFGHYTFDGDLLTLFNDPECGTELGMYRVERDGAQLRFDAEDDPCAFGQRTRDLTDRTWTPVDIARGESCQPPNTEAAVSGHWPVPPGC
ncbi:MAG TPA: hypothetical protein VLA76_07680 [Candidatus Angelobacter sp.]|nr:hypothetical protein [Candidatus Angelobacter sp.]